MTSAKLNKNIEVLFLELTERMIQRADELESQNKDKLGRTGSRRKKVVIVEDEQEQPPQKAGCCGEGT